MKSKIAIDKYIDEIKQRRQKEEQDQQKKNIEKRENDSRDKSADTTQIVDVKSELECPVCFELSRPPIFQCPEGHIICNECRPKVTR